MMFNLPKTEEEILNFWEKEKIFEKSLEKTKKSPKFVFYEGPPTANGRPHLGHFLTRAFKDIILRYKTMQGFFVERRAGWDTHGLPVELEVEKQLGFKAKKDIENYGIDKFNKKCQESVWVYKSDWEKMTKRMGFWIDLKNPYITYMPEYIETVWWILKKIWQNGLLYQDYRVVPYCPRCQTGLSTHEAAQGYKKIKEPAIYVKFKINDLKFKNSYLLVWTTTPWTLPANIAIAVNQKIKYVLVKSGKENLILAKSKLNILGKGYKILKEFKGKDLEGLQYFNLYPSKNIKPFFKVIEGDFVNTEEGTGLVHIAPAFGQDDLAVFKKFNMEFPKTVDRQGKMFTPNYKWDKLFVKDADPLIIEDLENKGILFKKELYEHDYPFCWRCHTPLIYYVKESWFIKITNLQKELIRNSQKINWIPSHLKNGRFGEWISDIKDWNLSRERYWGTPLPVWQCQNSKNKKNCDNIKVVGSIKELEELSGKKISDLHRPYVDEIIFKCEKCGGNMKRVPEVIDCWFDSGSMPFAQAHFPFSCAKSKNQNYKDLVKQIPFPADFICEGIDQTRGWFYTLLAVSTLLGLGPSYKNVISLGHVLDAKGQKMSKSKGNVVAPQEVINKLGADCVRFYFYAINQAGEPKRFDPKDIQILYRKIFDTLINVMNFFFTYTSESNFKKKNNFKPNNLLDKWIASRLNNLNFLIIKNLDKYDVVAATRLFEDFIDDLSNWYVRRSRQRFQKPKNKKEFLEASQTLYYVLITLSELMAPFTPFISEYIFQKLKGKDASLSVHLCNYPKPKLELIDKNLEEKMKETREIVAKSLAERVKEKIKVRQPLASLKIKNQKSKIKNNNNLLDLIKEEVNVKKIIFDSKIKNQIKLDTKITPKLKEEGMVREIIRQIQELRKKSGFLPKDKILVEYFIEDKFLNNIFEKNKKVIGKETKVKKFLFQEKIKSLGPNNIKKVDENNIYLIIKKYGSRRKI